MRDHEITHIESRSRTRWFCASRLTNPEVNLVGRPKHGDKDLEAVLRAAERQGWVITKGNGYFKMWCPCAGKHWKTVHCSPSSRRYTINLLSKLRRDTCWDEEGAR